MMLQEFGLLKALGSGLVCHESQVIGLFVHTRKTSRRPKLMTSETQREKKTSFLFTGQNLTVNIENLPTLPEMYRNSKTNSSECTLMLPSSSSNTGAPNVSGIPGGGPQWTPTSTHHHHHLPTHATVSTMSHVAGDQVNGNVVLENGRYGH